MSETRRLPRQPPPPPERRQPNRMLLAALAALLLLLIVLLVVTTRDGERPVASETTTATPTGVVASDTPAAAPPSPTEAGDADPEPDEEPAPAPTATGRTQPGDPTDADAAAFVASYDQGTSDTDSAAVDVNGDGVNEVVVAGVANGATRIDVAAWDGFRYDVVFTDQGGAADRLENFLVQDYTNDGAREIVTLQASGAEGRSLSVWGWNGAEYVRHAAIGGCWDGSHTYGVIGARIEASRIVATCDASPLPTTAWPSDVYVWNGSNWVYESTEG